MKMTAELLDSFTQQINAYAYHHCMQVYLHTEYIKLTNLCNQMYKFLHFYNLMYEIHIIYSASQMSMKSNTPPA